MNIDFICRSDSDEKFGGDSLQLMACMTRLAAAGYSVRSVPFTARMDLRPGALVHVFNIDRPYDFLDAMRQARGHRVVVSPIHHSLARVRLMRGAEQGYSVRAVSSRLLPESLRELCAFGIRSSRHSTAVATIVQFVRSLPNGIGVWKRVGKQLDRCDAVALLAEGERRALISDTGWSGRNGVLAPNGAPDGLEAGGPTAWDDRPEGMVVLGRIEPRKRQAELAEAAGRRGLPMTFAGGLNANAGPYGRRFLRAVEEFRCLRWLGQLPHSETLHLLGDARVLVNASWVEVQSLVDLEAAAMGCWVVAAPGGNSAEWLGDVVQETAGSVDDLLDVAARRADSGEAPPPFRYVWTWDETARVLDGVYREIALVEAP